MTELSAGKCVPCEGGVPPLTLAQATALRKQLHEDWKISGDGKSLRRSLKFKDFYRTMSFVNAVAHIANAEDHHPDLEIGYAKRGAQIVACDAARRLAVQTHEAEHQLEDRLRSKASR